MDKVNSLVFLKPLWLCWKILGIVRERSKLKILYLIYAILLNTVVTLYYPVHLLLVTFRTESMADNFKNLAITVTVVACSLKFIVFATKLKKVQEVEKLLQALDSRAKSNEEKLYFQLIHRYVRRIIYIFLSVYIPIGLTAELSFLSRTESTLLYPAWFPFDWRHSTWKFYLAHLYQIVGIGYLIMQNYVDDTFPPITLCLLSGHIKLLGLRVAKIGYEIGATLEENERELLRCIGDQKNLYKLFDTIQDIISIPMFIQFTVTAVNICVAMAALIFYVSTPMDRLYYFVYFLAMPLQIFPTCYYGTNVQYLFEQLHYDIFSSNWTQQSRHFKKDMQIFTERSQKKTTALAAGWIKIHLDTFFSTIKGAYSLFTVIMKTKK